ncbi:DUF1059 domain-containing protein [Chloroflexota bacterium]
MKTMTCKQLGGPCSEEFHAETFDKMVKLSQEHGIKMAENGDADHINVMAKMKEGMNDPEAMKAWVESVKQEFNALPEDK